MNIVRSSFNLYKLQQSTLKPIISRNYAFKSDLKIKWVRPEKIPCIKPEKSGDLSPMTEIDSKRIRPQFEKCKELEDADENVRKLFTLEYAPHVETMHLYIRNTEDMVRRHARDKGSIETRLATWTAVIRALQKCADIYPRNKWMKVKLKELIDKRKKHLKYLRRWDYKKFEWILETLNIVYKPPPNEFHWITRKDSLRKLTQKYCDDIKQNRLDVYKQQLEEQKPAFLEEKIQLLEFIREEQKSCGVDVTVSQEEIDQTKKQLEHYLNTAAKQAKVAEEQ